MYVHIFICIEAIDIHIEVNIHRHTDTQTHRHTDHTDTHTHTYIHTHTHTLSSPWSRKGCLRKWGTGSRRCVHNNTQRHNNTDAESHSQNWNSNVARAFCRGSAGRLRLPKTQSNTRTYGTKKSSCVHAYIGKDGKRRKNVLVAKIRNT